jgi:hypothetical protein
MTDLNKYPAIETVTKPMLTTEEAAFYLNRKPQTLRTWACGSRKGAPVTPKRILGRLFWSLKDIKEVLGV